MATREKFARVYHTTIGQLLAWEAQPDFMEAVLDDNTHIILKRPAILAAFLKRATNVEDKQMLTYAAALLIVMGDEAGKTLADLEARK